MDMVSNQTCGTRMWWKVARQRCRISKAHTQTCWAFYSLKEDSSSVALKLFSVNKIAGRGCAHNNWNPAKINLKLNLYSPSCGGDVRSTRKLKPSSTSANAHTFYIMLLWQFNYSLSWLHCVALFGKVPNIWLQEKQLEFAVSEMSVSQPGQSLFAMSHTINPFSSQQKLIRQQGETHMSRILTWLHIEYPLDSETVLTFVKLNCSFQAHFYWKSSQRKGNWSESEGSDSYLIPASFFYKKKKTTKDPQIQVLPGR